MNHARQYRVDAAVLAEIDAYMKRPCSPPPADGLTPMQRMQGNTALIQQANAEWDAIPSDPEELRAWMRGEPIEGGL
jgi:hypothetical protein